MEKKPVKKLVEYEVLSVQDLHETLPLAIERLKSKHKDGIIRTGQTSENIRLGLITVICEVFINE